MLVQVVSVQQYPLIFVLKTLPPGLHSFLYHGPTNDDDNPVNCSGRNCTSREICLSLILI